MNAVPVIALDHPVACDAARVGDDAAALATARAAGLPVGRGVVLTPEWSTSDAATVDMLWQIVSHDGALRWPCGPRQSDRARSSRPGSCTVPPTCWRRRTSAHGERSGGRARAACAARRMARCAHRRRRRNERDARRHLVHAATNGGDWIAELDRAGRVRRVLAGQQLDHPPVEVLVRLGRLTDRLEAVLGEAHDVEFAVHGGHVRALHLRSGVSAYLTEYQFETAA